MQIDYFYNFFLDGQNIKKKVLYRKENFEKQEKN